MSQSKSWNVFRNTGKCNGGWTVDNSPYITQAKEKFDQYPVPISPNIPMPKDWHVMTTDWDDYSLDMKLLKHTQTLPEYYWSTHMDNFNTEV